MYGHIHRPYSRELGALTVANSGSVGMPWDGDPRASYLLVKDGRPRCNAWSTTSSVRPAILLGGDYPDAQRLVAMRRGGVFIQLGGT